MNKERCKDCVFADIEKDSNRVYCNKPEYAIMYSGKNDVCPKFISRTATKIYQQLKVLREVANEYPGKTIENIIVQLEARLKELN